MKLIKSFIYISLFILFVISVKAQDDPVRIGFGVGFGREPRRVAVLLGRASRENVRRHNDHLVAWPA